MFHYFNSISMITNKVEHIYTLWYTHKSSHIVYNFKSKISQLILVDSILFILQKRKHDSEVFKLLAWRLPTHRCQSWGLQTVLLVPELELLVPHCAAHYHLHLLVITACKLKQEDRALPCLTSARNMCIVPHKVFAALCMSMNYESLLIFYFEVPNKFQGASKFLNME